MENFKNTGKHKDTTTIYPNSYHQEITIVSICIYVYVCTYTCIYTYTYYIHINKGEYSMKYRTVLSQAYKLTSLLLFPNLLYN